LSSCPPGLIPVFERPATFGSAHDTGCDLLADLSIRTGYLALREIAAFLGLACAPDPRSGDPISISRGEYDGVYNRVADLGFPLSPDRHQAWRDFVGWRFNYDTVLLALARLTMAPYAPWSSDRSAIGAGRPRPAS